MIGTLGKRGRKVPSCLRTSLELVCPFPEFHFMKTREKYLAILAVVVWATVAIAWLSVWDLPQKAGWAAFHCYREVIGRPMR